MMFHSKVGKSAIYKKTKGFSLIELMVVMAIMAVLLSLTGGLVTKNVDQQAKLVELEKVKQVFKRLGYKAFYSGYNVYVKAKGYELIISTNNQEYSVAFEYLSFKELEYTINTKAHVTPGYYTVIENEQAKEYFIEPMFKLYEER